MKTRGRKVCALLLFCAMLLGSTALLSGCSPIDFVEGVFANHGTLIDLDGSDKVEPTQGVQPPEQNDDAEFVFTGTGEAATGRTLTFTMTGNKSGNTLSISIAELPALGLTGTWEKVDGKGYKIRLDDAGSTLKYAQYDMENQEFFFDCAVATGSYGNPTVRFTWKNEAFASEYDGVGLGKEPPIFSAVGWAGGVIEFEGRLVCQEDGTFSYAGDWMDNRTGTWELDEGNNQYILTYDETSANLFYDLYQRRVEVFGDDAQPFTYKPGHNTTPDVDPDARPAETLDAAAMEENNWFRDPVICTWNEETQAYTGYTVLFWNFNEVTQQRGEITGIDLTFAG